jgi:hypothetical protein
LKTIRKSSQRRDRGRRRGTKERGVASRVLTLLALAAVLFAGAVAPAVAAGAPSTPRTAAVAHTAAKATPKPAPVAPKGVAVGKEFVPKPHATTSKIARPLTAWSISLAASSYALWPTQYTTLTATASADVGPTIYYIYILDADTGTVLAECGTGTTCSVAVTKATATYDGFYAYVSTATDVDGNQEIAISSQVDVEWYGLELSLAASADTLPVGDTSVLTSTTTSDIGPTPFFVQIWDTTTDTLLVQCGTGFTCSADVSQSAATTHTYVATFAGYASSYPPPELQATSGVTYVTWTGSGMQISLTAPGDTYAAPETVTATASVNVGPTPYYIEVFNENGTLLDTCGSGTTCSFSYTPAEAGSYLVAFIASSSTTLPPTNIQASSNTVLTYYTPAPS